MILLHPCLTKPQREKVVSLDRARKIKLLQEIGKALAEAREEMRKANARISD